jgi:hypothetical protein
MRFFQSKDLTSTKTTVGSLNITSSETDVLLDTSVATVPTSPTSNTLFDYSTFRNKEIPVSLIAQLKDMTLCKAFKMYYQEALPLRKQPSANTTARANFCKIRKTVQALRGFLPSKTTIRLMPSASSLTELSLWIQEIDDLAQQVQKSASSWLLKILPKARKLDSVTVFHDNYSKGVLPETEFVDQLQLLVDERQYPSTLIQSKLANYINH